MGRKRDTDRLGHLVLKFNAVEVASIVNQYKDKTKNPKMGKACKGKAAEKALEAMLDSMRIIGSIMAKAESAKEFSFSKEDSKEVTIDDICKKMGIRTGDDVPEKELDEMITEAALDIANKIGVNPDNIVVGKIGGSSEMLDELMAVVKKHREAK